jgi:TolB-like protein/Tfp pilus assembly protein PilF
MEVPKKSQKTSKRKPRGLSATHEVKPSVYEFGVFRLDERERLLTRNGDAVPLTPKVFDILLFLLQNSGSLVSKETLLSRVWPDAFVEEANLNVNVATLRKALGERPNEHRYIETIPKLGYRFVAKVIKREANRDRTNKQQPRATPLVEKQTASDAELKNFNSLAVLPFHNGSDDPNAEYLSDGLTESIINSLSYLRDLRVLGRNTVFRYKGKKIESRKIGEELGVSSVVTGRILQLGDQLIIRAELTAVRGGWQLWGEQYHRKPEDILTIQEEIAKEISEKLRLKLTVDEKRQLTKRHTDNTEAYHLYLKGHYHWNKYAHEGLGKAIEYFRRAIDQDPTYALAYAGLADSYYRLSNLYLSTREAMPKAKVAARKALEIDETLAEAHAALGLVHLFYDWDWTAAEREFTRAIELNSGYAIAHQRMALYLNVQGRFDDAMNELKLAMDLDPLSLQISQSVAFQFFLQGETERAIEQLEKTLEMNANYHPSYYVLGWVYKRKGDFAKMVECFEKVSRMDDSPVYVAALAHAYGLTGDHSKALVLLDELEKQSKHRNVPSYAEALVYIGLNQKDQAFAWLDKAFEERSEMLPWLDIGVEYDSLRADARFIDLRRRVGLRKNYSAVASSASVS